MTKKILYLIIAIFFGGFLGVSATSHDRGFSVGPDMAKYHEQIAQMHELAARRAAEQGEIYEFFVYQNDDFKIIPAKEHPARRGGNGAKAPEDFLTGIEKARLKQLREEHEAARKRENPLQVRKKYLEYKEHFNAHTAQQGEIIRKQQELKKQYGDLKKASPEEILEFFRMRQEEIRLRALRDGAAVVLDAERRIAILEELHSVRARIRRVEGVADKIDDLRELLKREESLRDALRRIRRIDI